MSAKIDTINLERGDHIFIRFEGSAENSLLLKVDERGVCTVQGPMNVNSKTLQVTIAGVQEAPPKERDYKPAKGLELVEIGRIDCPLAVLRSHPDFPETLSPELEGVWTGTNPAWPTETIKWILRRLEPPCHTDFENLTENPTEEKDGLKAFTVYVKPGPKPAIAEK